MALTPCRECGRTISTEAATCPGCGVPDPGRGYPAATALTADLGQIVADLRRDLETLRAEVRREDATRDGLVQSAAAGGSPHQAGTSPAAQSQELEVGRGVDDEAAVTPAPASCVAGCEIEFLAPLRRYRVTVTSDLGTWRVLRRRGYVGDDLLASVLEELRSAVERDFYRFWQGYVPGASSRGAHRKYNRLRAEARALEAVLGAPFLWAEPRYEYPEIGY